MTEWPDGAACVDSIDPDAWFELEDAEVENREPDPARIEWALAHCRRCEVVEECLQRSRLPKTVGVWAGLTERDRKRLRRAGKLAGVIR